MLFLAFSPDGALLVFPGKSRALCLWDIKARKEKWSLKIGLVPSTAAFSPDGKFLAIGTHTTALHGSARIIHSETGKPARGLWFWYHGALQLAYSADGKQIFGGFRRKVFRRDLTKSAKVNDPGDAIIWDASKGRDAEAMAFCSGGRLVALRVGDELKVVDTQFGKPKLTVIGASGPIAFSPDGRRLAVSCWDGTTKIWDIK
jgi:WD40 repeat protein